MRDALLGSIWEGTSKSWHWTWRRSARREYSAAVARLPGQGLLADAGVPTPSRAALRLALDRAFDFAAASVSTRQTAWKARRAASALYHCASAVFMAWEAAQDPDGDYRRLALAHLVLKHRLLPQNPLAADDAPLRLTRPLLDETPLRLEQALALLPA